MTARGTDGRPTGIVGFLEYAVDLFERPSAEALTERLVRLLEAAVADPDRVIGLIDILSPAERTALLRDGEGIHVASPPATLPELFVVRAAGTPDATAVVYGNESLSYDALDRRTGITDPMGRIAQFHLDGAEPVFRWKASLSAVCCSRV